MRWRAAANDRSDADAMQSLAEKLKKGMGSWSDFDDAPADAADEGAPSKRQRGKKKVRVPIGAATARVAPAAGAAKAPGEIKCRVEVSRNGRGGKTGCFSPFHFQIMCAPPSIQPFSCACARAWAPSLLQGCGRRRCSPDLCAAWNDMA